MKGAYEEIHTYTPLNRGKLEKSLLILVPEAQNLRFLIFKMKHKVVLYTIRLER